MGLLRIASGLNNIPTVCNHGIPRQTWPSLTKALILSTSVWLL